MTSSTLLADPPSNETIDVLYIKMLYMFKTFVSLLYGYASYIYRGRNVLLNTLYSSERQVDLMNHQI